MTSAGRPTGAPPKPIGQGLAIAATTGCLCLVAAGANRSRSLSAGLLHAGALPSLVLVGGAGALLAAVGLIGITYAFWPQQLQRRHREDEVVVETETRSAPWWGSLLAAAASVLLVASAVVAVMQFRTDDSPPAPRSVGPATTIGVRDRPDLSEQRPGAANRVSDAPPTIWWAVVLGATATISVVGIAVTRRGYRRRRLSQGSTPSPAAMVPIDELRGGLLAEPDCRRAVIGAYGAMERELASAGVGRDAWEGPFEYRERLRASLGSRAKPAGTLTDLFVRAKFSDQPVDIAMKHAAIDALNEADGISDADR